MVCAAFPFLTVSSIFCWISSSSTLEVLQHRRGDALTLADQAEQDVLRAHVLVVETRGFLARHREDLPHPLGEVVAVHIPSDRPGWTCRLADRARFLFQRFTHIACARQVRLALRQRSSFGEPTGARPARRSGAC